MQELWNKSARYLYDTLGGHVRLVGGCVRDHLLHKEFSDRDMATTLTPEEVIAKLDRAHIPHVDIGKDFGTVIAKVDGMPFEITTLRKDIKTDGRHAVVAWAKRWSTDARRRDFTVNALYADIHGKIWDYVGGVDDLKQNRLRFIGSPDKRIKEDYLRILRYFRFFTLMKEKTVPKDVACAIQKHKEGLNSLSGDRKRDEMFRLIIQPGADKTLTVMEDMGILSYLQQIQFSKKQKKYFFEHDIETMLARFNFLV